MRQFFSNIINAISGFISTTWKHLSSMQKIIALAIVGVLLVVMVTIASLSARPNKVYLFTNGITDPGLLTRIANKLDTENIVYEIDASSRIVLKDKNTALYARSLLVQEDLVPGDTDPWELFDTTRWTQTDFERNINLQRSITKQVEQHIEALDDVDDAKVTIVMPEDSLFIADRKPVTASVILRFKPGSDFIQNRKKIEGVEKLILFAIENLSPDNLVISDVGGVRLNDFENLADFDGLEQTKREMQIKANFENTYKENILKALSDIYSPDRVRIVNIDIEIDFSKKYEETVENFPIVITPDNPATPYDDSKSVLSVVRSEENIVEEYSGTGFNPEGPPGVEGQTPPSYKDLDGIVGSWNHTSKKVNNEINQKTTKQESRPSIERVSASVAIDGLWFWQYDENGVLQVGDGNRIEREYITLTKEEIKQALSLIQSAVGYSQMRGDLVSVENVKFDRTAQFNAEDGKYLRNNNIKKYSLYAAYGIVGLFLFIVLLRFLLRQIEKIKVRREEKLADQYRRMREAQIMEMMDYEEAEEEETELQKLTNEVAEIVSQNPEEISILIRSWMEA